MKKPRPWPTFGCGGGGLLKLALCWHRSLQRAGIFASLISSRGGGGLETGDVREEDELIQLKRGTESQTLPTLILKTSPIFAPRNIPDT